MPDSADQVAGPDELQRGRGGDDRDVVAGLGEAAQHLARLVGGDAAGDPQNDAGPRPGAGRGLVSEPGVVLVLNAGFDSSLEENGSEALAVCLLAGRLGGGLLGGELGRVDVLAGQQVAGVDLAQRDREGLLLDVRVDQRADVLEEALAELRVVGVDLPGTLGAVEDQLVLAVGLGEQVVDRGVGDALGGDVGCRHASASQIVGESWQGIARSEVELSVSGVEHHQAYQLLGRSVNFVVDDGDVELVLGGQLARAAVSSRRSRSSAVSVPRPTSRRTSSSQDGGIRKTKRAAGIVSRTWRAPCRSISSSAGQPLRERLLDGLARGAVAGPLVHDRPLEQLAALDHRVELVVGDEPVVDAVLLPGPRRARGRRDREPHLGVPPAYVGRDGALADGRGAGEHDEAGRPRGQPAGSGSVTRPGRTRAPARPPAWCPDRARGGSRRCRGAPWSGGRAPCPGRASTAAGRRPHLADDVVLLALAQHVGDLTLTCHKKKRPRA